LGEITGNRSIKMSWTAVDFHQRIELPYGIALVGWPTDIARTNLSKIGGCTILDNLLTKWRTGKMRFELLDPARRPVRLELRRHTRSDAGHSHVFADKREPMKRKRRGHKVPKSALIIENSDASSDADAAAGGNIGSQTESADEDESQICKRRRLDLDIVDQYGNSSAPETIKDFSSDARSLAETIEDADDWDILILPIATLRGCACDQHGHKHLRYIELAIEHCAEVHIFLPFDILLHREDVPFDNIDACMQQHSALTYSVLKHYLPANADPTPLIDAPVRGVVSPEERAGLTPSTFVALTALERLTQDLARIDLAAYFGLLWSIALADCARIDLAVYLNLLWRVPLGVRPADLVQELLLILRERLAGEGGKDTARRDMYKATLRTADACSCRGGIRRGVEPGRIAQSVVEDAEFREQDAARRASATRECVGVPGRLLCRRPSLYTPLAMRSYTPLTLRSLVVSNGHLCHTSPSAPETIIWMAPGHILVLACHTESALAMSTGNAAPVEAPRAGK
ncbi:hypothetical protein POSPLADRAFT_1142031, partial [Postia placenta MAD-698-R-SB12]